MILVIAPDGKPRLDENDPKREVINIQTRKGRWEINSKRHGWGPKQSLRYVDMIIKLHKIFGSLKKENPNLTVEVHLDYLRRTKHLITARWMIQDLVNKLDESKDFTLDIRAALRRPKKRRGRPYGGLHKSAPDG